MKGGFTMNEEMLQVTVLTVFKDKLHAWKKQSGLPLGRIVELLILEQCPSVLERDPENLMAYRFRKLKTTADIEPE
jgi:cell division inhibitor SulA